ncbi:fibroblast growth factor receptor 2-like isoform X4 [Orbicella faveolata]|uniref:fibroblast growth factor receptor 2-like isoform X4 n=1 Tax=Orbicella faveolata TaxID=48498 RepID=UPI0009E413D0|nr:fibroblast growth factor receptor 2-like isoform X4 [Orbicella faveolata]
MLTYRSRVSTIFSCYLHQERKEHASGLTRCIASFWRSKFSECEKALICRRNLNWTYSNASRVSLSDKYPPRRQGTPNLQYDAEAGAVKRLRCGVIGQPPPTITWFKDDKPLQLSERVKNLNNNKTIKIKTVRPRDQGNYTCIAENTLGKLNLTLELIVREGISPSLSTSKLTPTSQVVTTRVQTKDATTSGRTKKSRAPRFSDPNMLKRAFRAWPASHSIRLKCQATGAPPLKYTWLKDGMKMPSRRMDPYLNTSIWYLKLKDLVPDDSGKYTCIVSNPYGSINHTYTLQVVAKPRSRPILQTSLPSNTTVQIGDNATMTCIVLVSGTLPDFRWLKWDKSVLSIKKIGDDFENGSYRLIDPHYYKTIRVKDHYGVELRITNVTEDDFGLYTCFVSNHIGKDYNSAFLSRYVKPTVPVKVDWNTITKQDDSSQNATASPIENKLVQNEKIKSSQAGLIAIILLASIVFSAIIAVVFVFCFRKRLKEKFAGDSNSQKEFRQFELENIPPSSNLIPSEPETPNQTDGNNRTFTFPRGRLSSTGSTNSTTPLLRYRTGSYRSRFSSGVSSRIDSNIAEELELFELPCDEEWEIDRSQITLREQLGEGAFGLVMRADAVGLPDMPSTCSVAVKMLKADATENELGDLLSEMDTMKDIGRHKNIINLIGACTQHGPLFVIVEFAPHGNLRQFLRERRPSEYQHSRQSYSGPSLTVRDFVSFAFQIARGMEYLGTRKCVHRDLAARNILVGDDYVMKIADFGLARNVKDLEYYRKTTDGRLPIKWLAIEALFDRVYTTQSDVWAFGILLWEIFTLGGSPYPGIPVEKLFDLLKSGYRMQKPQNCPSDIYDIMLNCWDENSTNRASFTQLRKRFDAMLSSMASKEYLEILAQSIDDLARDMETPITDDSDINNEGLTESSC